MKAPIEWLLGGEPFIRYRTGIDLLGEDPDGGAALADRRAMMEDPRLAGLVAELGAWPWKVISSHRSAGQPFHKLAFLADLGVRSGDPGVGVIVANLLEHRSAEGVFALPMEISESHGGNGSASVAWALCDAPLLVHGLAGLGLRDHPAVREAVVFLAGLARGNGWPCAVSPELGSFRGPGRKEDPCPFATLAMLKAASHFEDLRDGPAARAGTECLLSLWADSRSRHPYIFWMGMDFRKLKAPFVWYDILNVLDALSRFPRLAGDPRLEDMTGVMMGKADADGRFTPESVWQPWREWEFGQKIEPSRWLTFLAWRIAARLGKA